MSTDPILSPVIVSAVLDGLNWAVMLILISVGLSLIFGFLEVINFAHGAFYMLGGYILYATVQMMESFWIGLLTAIVAIAVLGAITEFVLLRPSYDLGPITQVLIMIGLAFIVQGMVIIIWGERAKSVNRPSMLSGPIEALGVAYPKYRAFQIVLGVILIGAIWAFLRYTNIGLVIRASLSDKTMAYALGNDIPRIYTLVFAGGVATAALAGALMTPIRSVDPLTGGTILLQAFIVVVVGGLGSFRGTILAGLLIGMTDTLVARFVSFKFSGLVGVAILLVVLVIRPRGFFGEKGVME